MRLATRGTALMQRVTRAFCPPAEREWVDAVFAEASAVEGRWRRMSWALGALSVSVTALRVNVASLPTRMRWAAALASGAATLSGVCSITGYEGLKLDDDVYLASAFLSGAVLLSLAFASFGRIFGRANLLPGARE
jgi:hypothetical protein